MPHQFLLGFSSKPTERTAVTGFATELPLSCDGVSLGSAFARHEQPLGIGCGRVCSVAGALADAFLEAPFSGADHRGDAAAKIVLQALARRPWFLAEDELRRRLPAVCADVCMSSCALASYRGHLDSQPEHTSVTRHAALQSFAAGDGLLLPRFDVRG